MADKKRLAVEIGNSTIKMAYGRVSKGRLEISEYAVADTPAESISDGRILDARAVANVIRELADRHRMKTRKLILNVTGTGVITRDIIIPSSNDKEIEKILEFEAQQYFPVDLENYCLDYRKLEAVNNNEGSFDRLLLVAVPEKQMGEYMKLPELLGMELAAADISANSMSKLIRYALSGKDDPDNEKLMLESAVIDVGSDTTGVCIFSKGILQFNRMLLNGSREIDRLISEEYGLSFAEAEKEKKVLAHISMNIPQPESPEDSRINLIIRPAVNSLLTDINRFFEFYSSRNSSNGIRKIYLMGGGSKLKGFRKYLNDFFSLPVDYLRPGEEIAYTGGKTKQEFEKDFCLIANAVGSLVRYDG